MMRNKYLLFLFGAFFATQLYAGEVMIDPILGISYNPQKIHFETVEIATTRLCGFSFSNAGWLYSSFEENGIQYLVVSGFQLVDRDPMKKQKSGKTEPSFGVVVMLSDDRKRCKKIGSPDVIFAGEGDMVTIPITGLLKDARRRFLSAFGGELPFEHALKTQGITPQRVSEPVRSVFFAQ